MSTKELLRKFKALPSKQQAKFLSQALRAKSKVKRVRKVIWPDVESRARRITEGCVLPNLVIVDRDESAF